jgi:hypothetical protein
MIQWLKRRRAVATYFWRLSQELSQRFGRKNYYSVEEVSRAAREKNFDVAFLVYAHGMFCSRGNFDDYYASSDVAYSYDAVRQVVARRFFSSAPGFDALNILIRAGSPMEREYAFDQSATTDN